MTVSKEEMVADLDNLFDKDKAMYNEWHKGFIKQCAETPASTGVNDGLGHTAQLHLFCTNQLLLGNIKLLQEEVEVLKAAQAAPPFMFTVTPHPDEDDEQDTGDGSEQMSDEELIEELIEELQIELNNLRNKLELSKLEELKTEHLRQLSRDLLIYSHGRIKTDWDNDAYQAFLDRHHKPKFS